MKSEINPTCLKCDRLSHCPYDAFPYPLKRHVCPTLSLERLLSSYSPHQQPLIDVALKDAQRKERLN